MNNNFLYLAVSIMMGMSVIGASLGIAIVGSQFLKSTSRQPSLVSVLRTQFFVVVGLIDAVPMITIGISLFLLFMLSK